MNKQCLGALLFLCLFGLTTPAQTPTPTPTDWKLTGKTGASDTAGPVYLYADSSVLIGVYFQGVYRSTDKGKTWALIGLPTYSTHNILRIGTTLVAATGEGFWRSTDNGATWLSANSSLKQWFGGDNAISLTLMNGVIYAGMGEFAGSPRCLLSRDEGLTWVRADKGLEAAKNGFSMANLNGVLLYGDRDGKIYRSTDGAQNWTEATTGLEVRTKPTIVTSHRHFFVAHDKGIFRSDNYGQSWTQIFIKGIIAAAAAIPSSNIAVRGRTIMVITGTGNSLPPSTDIYYSNDYGQNWKQSFAPYAQDVGIITSLYAIAFADKAYMLAKGGAYANDKILPPALGLASAASFKGGVGAPDSIAALFGTALANAPASARTIPLPTTVGGARLKLWDSNGNESFAPLFFVSPGQMNFQIPATLPNGTTIVTTELNGVATAEGQMNIASVAPGIFAANANGQGCPAGYFIRVRNGVLTNEIAITYDSVQKKFVTSPLDLGPDSDQVFLVLFGTGVRAHGGLTRVTATINGVNAEVLYAGAVNGLVGLDQVNLRVPRTLKGVNKEVDVVLTVLGNAANAVKIFIR